MAACNSAIIVLLLIPSLLLFLLLQFHQNFPFMYNSPCSDKCREKNDPVFARKDYKAAAPNKKHGLERIEQDLAVARAKIQKAIRLKNSKLQQQFSEGSDFIPRGSIFRNSYAFHQSHIEMMKKFKIWTYKEGDIPLVHTGPMKDIYGIEGQFIAEMEEGMSHFTASNPDEAHVFFIPISVTNIVEYVYSPITTYSRHQLQSVVRDYIHVIAHKYPYWNRSNGADHFFLSCHDWAPDVSKSNPKLYEKLIRVLCNANFSEGFQPQRDVSMPEIYVPSENLTPPDLSHPPNNRSILAFFAGGAHGNIRKSLIHHWKNKDSEIKVYEYLSSRENYTKLMGQSKFCLCPSGFEVASPRVVEAIYAGCVPVLISDHYSLPISDVLDWTQFSISIPVDKIAKIKTILQGISNYKYLKMQKRVRRLKKHFKINRPAKSFDVIHMLLHSVWLRRLNIMLHHIYF